MIPIIKKDVEFGPLYIFYFNGVDEGVKSIFIMRLDSYDVFSTHPYIGSSYMLFRSQNEYNLLNKKIRKFEYSERVGYITLFKEAEIFKLTDNEILNIVALNI